MKRSVCLLSILVFLAVGAGLAGAQSIELTKASVLTEILKRGELKVGMEAGYMPFEMRSKKGEIIGFDVDCATAMAKAMGVKLALVNTAWDGIIPSLLTKKFDIIMSGMTVTQERNLRVNFVEPYITIGQTLLVNKKHEGKVKSYQDLNDPKYVITSKLGTTGAFAAQRLMPKAKLNLFETEPEAAMEVINDRADAFIYDQPYCAVFNARNPGKLVFLDQPFTYEPLGWAVRKGDPDFLNWLTNFLHQIRGDGTYEAAYKKWFLSSDWLQEVQ